MFGKSTKKIIVSAAECMTKKAVFCAGTACTTEQMKLFVENMGVKVRSRVSKPSRVAAEVTTKTQLTKGKRSVYVSARIMFNVYSTPVSAWPDSIVISEWFFKQSTRNVQNTVDKRRRIGSGERDERQARQSTLVQSRSQSAAHCITTGMCVDADQDVVTTAEHSGSSDIARHNDDAIDEGERTVVVSDDTILTAINT